MRKPCRRLGTDTVLSVRKTAPSLISIFGIKNSTLLKILQPSESFVGCRLNVESGLKFYACGCLGFNKNTVEDSVQVEVCTCVCAGVLILSIFEIDAGRFSLEEVLNVLHASFDSN